MYAALKRLVLSSRRRKEDTPDSMKSVKHRISEKVYLAVPGSSAPEGPYLVATVLSEYEPPRYTLCLDNGDTVHGGRAFEESTLRKC